MIVGEPVVVIRRTEIGRNAHNRPVYETTSETVDNVLVSPGPRADIPDTSRPDGVTIRWTLHFPKTFAADLEGAQVAVRGGEPCDVVGAPAAYTAANTPTDWWMPVELTRAAG